MASPEGHFEVDFRCFFFYVPVAGGISSSLKYSIDKFVSLGFKKELLKSWFISISKEHDFSYKYGNIDDLNSVFD